MSAIKRLCWFLLGVAVGVLGLSFYELFGKPVLPFDGKYDFGECDFDKSVYIKPKSTKKILIKFKNVGKGKPPTYVFDPPVRVVDTRLPHEITGDCGEPWGRPSDTGVTLGKWQMGEETVGGVRE